MKWYSTTAPGTPAVSCWRSSTERFPRPWHLDAHVVLDDPLAHRSGRSRSGWPTRDANDGTWTFSPELASWLNVVEGWFSILTRQALTNTSFTSVAELADRIDWWGLTLVRRP